MFSSAVLNSQTRFVVRCPQRCCISWLVLTRRNVPIMNKQQTRQPRYRFRKSSIVLLQLLPRRSCREIKGQANHTAPEVPSWHELSLFPDIRNIHFWDSENVVLVTYPLSTSLWASSLNNLVAVDSSIVVKRPWLQERRACAR